MNKIEVVCIVIGAIATVLGGVWFIIVRATKSGIKEYRLSRAESELSSLPCKEHDVSLLAHTQVIGNIESTLKENNSMLVELSKWVMKMDESMIERLAKKASPLRMTEAGEYLFNKSGADKALAELSGRLLNEIELSAPRTEYDVEQKALELLLKNMGDKAFDTVKKFIYYSPDSITVESTGEDIKFDMYAIVNLMGIKLRDLYLNTHGMAGD